MTDINQSAICMCGHTRGVHATRAVTNGWHWELRDCEECTCQVFTPATVADGPAGYSADHAVRSGMSTDPLGIYGEIVTADPWPDAEPISSDDESVREALTALPAPAPVVQSEPVSVTTIGGVGRCLFEGCQHPSAGTVQGVPICADHMERARREAQAGESEDPAVRAQMAEDRRNALTRIAGRCVQCGGVVSLDARQRGLFLCALHWAQRTRPRMNGRVCPNCHTSGALIRMATASADTEWQVYDCRCCDAQFRCWADEHVPVPGGQPEIQMIARMVPLPRIEPAPRYRTEMFAENGRPVISRQRRAPQRQAPHDATVYPTTREIDLPED